MLMQPSQTFDLYDRHRFSFLVASGLLLVVLAVGIGSSQADEPVPDAPQNPVGAEKSKSDSTPAVGAEFSFKVVTTDGKPVVDASVRPWAVGVATGSFGLPEKMFPPVKSDAEGIARVVIPKDGDDTFKLLHKADINRFALEVHHPDHPDWSEYINSDGSEKIVLVEPTTVEIRAHRTSDAAVLDRLYPMLAATNRYRYTDWSQADGKLTLRRVDLVSKEPWRWLRIVHAPEKGPAWFSDLIDLKQETGNPISLDVAMKPGVRLVGHLAEDVPRPVTGGKVVARIIDGTESWTNWYWQATAEIATDGTFELNSLPRDENLQIIAICDGWVSSSPTVDEVSDYSKKYDWGDLHYQGPGNFFVYPHLVRVGGPTANPVVAMDPTATCEITVVDKNNQPLADAEVSFWPNQFFFHAGSNLVGQGEDTLTGIREELKSSKPDRTRFDRKYISYSAKTDAKGNATIANLPVGPLSEGAPPREEWFNVERDGYVPIANCPNPRIKFTSTDPELLVKLSPGKTERVTIQMDKSPEKAK